MCIYKCFAIKQWAKLAKPLSRWRTMVIQDGAEFCIWWIMFYSFSLKGERLAWVWQQYIGRDSLDKKAYKHHAVENPGKIPWKNPGKTRAQTYGTKSPSWSEALHFIDSANCKSPSSEWLGDLVPNIRRFEPRLYQGFLHHGASWPLSRKLLSVFSFTCIACSLLLIAKCEQKTSFCGNFSLSAIWASCLEFVRPDSQRSVKTAL